MKITLLLFALQRFGSEGQIGLLYYTDRLRKCRVTYPIPSVVCNLGLGDPESLEFMIDYN